MATTGFGQSVATYATVSDWGGGFTGKISIKNPGANVISNWTLEFDWDRDLGPIWDGVLVSREGRHYKVRSAGWNSDILPGATAEFGFNGSPGSITAGPEKFLLGTDATTALLVPAPGSISAKLVQTAAYTGGFTGTLTVRNTGAVAIARWSLQFQLDRKLQAVYNANLAATDSGYILSAGPALPAGGEVSLTLTGADSLTGAASKACSLNSTPCTLEISLAPGVAPADNPITIEVIDTPSEAVQTTIHLGETILPLKLKGGDDRNFTVTTNNSTVVRPEITEAGELRLTGLASGRASVRIENRNGRAIRYLGIRVRDAAGQLPGMPKYLSIGSVSEDTGDHIAFWEDFQDPARNKRMDVRYIYLNGGPFQGWDTWGSGSGSRVVSYIRNSRRLGIIPFFVYYNVPEGSESYEVDLNNVQNPEYMKAYFKNLKLALDLINQEAGDDTVGIVLEPDFLGYLAQNAKAAARDVRAATSGAYTSGVLKAGEDPAFPDTVKGFVEAVNFTISKYSPQVLFGWQLNLWASPAGGWTTSVPAKGIIRKTDATPLPRGRELIYNEATAITRYYIESGITSHGAAFLSIDKYGLDATGFERAAAKDPAASVWFWNNDHWLNYMEFVRAMHDTAQLPVVLWQIPVGRINSSTEPNPYNPTEPFSELDSTHQRYEDSAPTFFLGDTFRAADPRFSYFSRNESRDTTLITNGDLITWGAHMQQAVNAGVVSVLFGAGVGASTNGVGTPPTDGFWWINKVQTYLAAPVQLP